MKRLSPFLLLAGAVAVVYLNSFRGAFQYDDYNVIVDNAGVHTWGAFLAGLPRGIRPLLKFSYTLNWTSGMASSQLTSTFSSPRTSRIRCITSREMPASVVRSWPKMSTSMF